MNESQKLFFPMIGREYCLTMSEQQDLARRFGLSIEDVRSHLIALNLEPQKTATKMKRAINESFRKP